MFRQVHSMIYIFDVESPAFSTSDADYFQKCLVALRAASSRMHDNDDEQDGSGENGPFVRVLIHKMDLVPLGTRDGVFQAKSEEIRKRCNDAGWTKATIFGTSIWNETLYRVCPHSTSYFFPRGNAQSK